MADVSHELGSLRFVVESPLSSKVAMFNNQAQQHQKAQLLNPFTNAGISGRTSPKPTFSKDEYGKPLAGSLTEMRGQKANIHVMKEMLELCQIISSEGYSVNDEPTMRVIPFGELFNIYNYISDKVVGILLRARKYKLVDFEGEMLFQRRDDNVPVFLLKPIVDIRHELEAKIADIKRASSPAPPQATSVLMDKSAHKQKLEEASLAAPKKRTAKTRSVSPAAGSQSKPPSKAASPVPEAKDAPTVEVADAKLESNQNSKETKDEKKEVTTAAPKEEIPKQVEQVVVAEKLKNEDLPAPSETNEIVVATPNVSPQPAEQQQQQPQTINDSGPPSEADPPTTDDPKTDVNNNNNNSSSVTELPTIVIEASAVYVIGGESPASDETKDAADQKS